MSNYYSGRGGRYIRHAFPMHLLMEDFDPVNRYIVPINERSFWDAVSDELKAHYIGKAQKYRDYVWKTVPVCETYLSFFEGKPRTAEAANYEKQDALAALILGECLENEGRFLRPIVNGIFSICEQTTWAVAAHFMACGENKETLPDPDDPVLDLAAPRAGTVLAMAYGMLGTKLDEISPVIRRRIRREIEGRLLDPYLARDDYWWMGFHMDRTFWSPNNWCSSVNARILYCALALDIERKKAYKIVDRAIDSLDTLVDAYPDDGACDEGPAYWFGAVMELFYALAMLHRVMGEKSRIWENPKIRAMAQYILHMRIDRNIYASVSDSHPVMKPDMSRLLDIRSIGDMFGDERFIREADALYAMAEREERPQFGGAFGWYYDLLYAGKWGKSAGKSDGIRKCWMPGVQIMASHECADTGRGLYLMIKGGHNHESHNHNDIGGFILYKDGKPVAVDAGIGTYSRTTFGEHRYENWWANGLHHSIPVIGGACQREGGQYYAGNAVCTLGEEADVLSLELKNAYPNADAIRTLIRTAKLDRTASAITIEDAYEFTVPMTFESRILLQHEPVMTEDGFISGGCRFTVDSSALYTVSVKQIDIDDPVFIEGWGERLWLVILAWPASEKGEVTITAR